MTSNNEELHNWPKIEADDKYSDDEKLSLYEISITSSSSPHIKLNSYFLRCMLHLKLACQKFGTQKSESYRHFRKGFQDYLFLGNGLKESKELQQNSLLMTHFNITNSRISQVGTLFPSIEELTNEEDAVNQKQESSSTKQNNKKKNPPPAKKTPEITASQKAYKLYSEGKYDKALKIFKRIIERDQADWMARISCLHIYNKLNQYSDDKRAEAKYIIDNLPTEESELYNNYRIETFFYIGLCHETSNNHELAIANFQRVKELSPKLAQLNKTFGQTRKAQMQDCIAQLDELDQTSQEAINLRQKRDEYAAMAVDLFSEVENNAECSFALGDLAALYGNNEEAIDHYIQAGQIEPKYNAAVQIKLGSLYIQQKEYSKAIEQYQMLLKNSAALKPALIQEITFLCGVAHERNNNLEAASKCYIETVRRDPLYCLGVVAIEKLAFQNKRAMPSLINLCNTINTEKSKEHYTIFLEYLQALTKDKKLDRLMKSLLHSLMGYIHSSQLKNIDATIESYQVANELSPITTKDMERLVFLRNLIALKENRSPMFPQATAESSPQEEKTNGIKLL
jgi:tetratricopeptide (TPR) repeat protein